MAAGAKRLPDCARVGSWVSLEAVEEEAGA